MLVEELIDVVRGDKPLRNGDAFSDRAASAARELPSEAPAAGRATLGPRPRSDHCTGARRQSQLNEACGLTCRRRSIRR